MQTPVILIEWIMITAGGFIVIWSVGTLVNYIWHELFDGSLPNRNDYSAVYGQILTGSCESFGILYLMNRLPETIASWRGACKLAWVISLFFMLPATCLAPYYRARMTWKQVLRTSGIQLSRLALESVLMSHIIAFLQQ